MTGLKSFFRLILVMIFGVALVVMGSEELRRHSQKGKPSEEERKYLMAQLRNQFDMNSPDVAKRLAEYRATEEQRAQLGSRRPEHEKVKSDPTSLRSLAHRLLD